MTGTAAFGGAGLLIIVGCGTATGCATCADLDGSAAAVPSTTRWLTGVGVVLAASWAPRDHHDASTSTSTTMAKGHFCIVLWPMQLTYRRAQPILRRTPSCVPMAPIMRVQTAAIGRCLLLLLSIDNLHSKHCQQSAKHQLPRQPNLPSDHAASDQLTTAWQGLVPCVRS